MAVQNYKNMSRYINVRAYENLQHMIYDGVGSYDIPEIRAMQFDGEPEFIGFNYASTASNRHDKAVHFFIDDYQFERLWRDVNRYTEMLSQFKYVMTPDFSTYTDFPKAIQIYNHYRKHWVGRYLQDYGCKVIPTISWSDKESFAWCFDGEPEGGTVAVSSVGCSKNKQAKELFMNGYNEMIDRLHPESIIFYGEVPKECSGNIVKIKAFQDKFRKAVCNGW